MDSLMIVTGATGVSPTGTSRLSKSRPRKGMFIDRKYPGLTSRQSADAGTSDGSVRPGTCSSVLVFPPDSGTALDIATDWTPGSAASVGSRRSKNALDLASSLYVGRGRVTRIVATRSTWKPG